MVRPGSTDEVAAVVRACAAAGTPVVPQGGNTGLVVGGVPVALRRRVLAIAFGEPQRQRPEESAQQFAERLERLSYALAAEADDARRG